MRISKAVARYCLMAGRRHNGKSGSSQRLAYLLYQMTEKEVERVYSRYMADDSLRVANIPSDLLSVVDQIDNIVQTAVDRGEVRMLTKRMQLLSNALESLSTLMIIFRLLIPYPVK